MHYVVCLGIPHDHAVSFLTMSYAFFYHVVCFCGRVVCIIDHVVCFLKTIEYFNFGYLTVRNGYRHGIKRKLNLCGAQGHTPHIRSPTAENSTRRIYSHTPHNHLVF